MKFAIIYYWHSLSYTVYEHFLLKNGDGNWGPGGLPLEEIFETVPSKMWENALLPVKMLLLTSLSLVLRRRNWLYQILKIWSEKGKCYVKFSFLLLYVCTLMQEVKPSQANMPKVGQSMLDYLCILPLHWQVSSKGEVLVPCSLICHLKFLWDLCLLSHSKIIIFVCHMSVWHHLCGMMLLDSRLSRGNSKMIKNCRAFYTQLCSIIGAMPLTSSVHGHVMISVEFENEDSNEYSSL